MKKIFSLACLICLVALPLSANDDFDWSKIDRVGLYDRKDDRSMGRDVWDDYSQSDAVTLLNGLPNRLTSPAYRELAARLLLSESDKNREDVDSPALLAKRLEKLISYGLFAEATELYQKAIESDETPENYELSTIDVQMTLANGDLAPVCLDIQASSNTFRNMPQWRELSDFCRLRFGSSEKIKLNTLQFKHYPELKSILESNQISILDMQSNMGILVAFSDKRISNDSYNKHANKAAIMPDLTLKMALNNDYAQNETYQCYAIEGAKRGIISAEDLKSIYTKANFSQDLLNSQSGEVSLHPCHVPAYFYQRLQNSAENTSMLVNAMLATTKSLPLAALSPMSDAIAQHAEPNNQWRATNILAISNKDIPEEYSNSVINPLRLILKGSDIDEDLYENWLKTDNNFAIINDASLDIAFLPYISQTLSSNKINFMKNGQNMEYGKFLSLTYTKKSLHLGLGLNDFMATTYDNGDHARVITSLLILAGDKDVNDLNPNDLSVILSGLKAYKLDKNAITLALEYLQ